MSFNHVNPLQWHQAVGIARQSCARFFRDGGAPADALLAFGLSAERARCAGLEPRRRGHRRIAVRCPDAPRRLTDLPVVLPERRRPRQPHCRGLSVVVAGGAERLRLELGIPIEIVEPALVQVVGREQPAVAVQLEHRRPVGRLPAAACRPRRGIVAALAQIARRARGRRRCPTASGRRASAG